MISTQDPAYTAHFGLMRGRKPSNARLGGWVREAF